MLISGQTMLQVTPLNAVVLSLDEKPSMEDRGARFQIFSDPGTSSLNRRPLTVLEIMRTPEPSGGTVSQIRFLC